MSQTAEHRTSLIRRALRPVAIILAVGVLSLWAVAAIAAAAGRAQPDRLTLSGALTAVWGDAQDGTTIGPFYELTTAEGQIFSLMPGQVGMEALNRLQTRQVTVSGTLVANGTLQSDGPVMETLAVDSLRSADSPRAAAADPIAGNIRWLSVACKFADKTNEQKSIAYFANMYKNSSPGLDHYWRQAWSDAINLEGSSAVGWYVLPQDRAYYLTATNNPPRLSELFTDCASLAEGDVHVADYDGVNIMLNDSIGAAAWGGGAAATIGGVNKSYRATWLPSWAFARLIVVEHEMGHGFGFPHSSAYGLPNTNAWDVMSDIDYYCAFTDPTYGCAGKHTIAINRDIAGWIPANRKYTAGSGTHHITLEQPTLPGDDGYLLAIIPINGSSTHYITAETRRRVGYDAGLPDRAVVLHEVRGGGQLTRLIDASQSFHGIGQWAMWQVGETYANEEGDILIHIDWAAATSYDLTIVNGAERRTVSLGPTDDTYLSEDFPDTPPGARWTAARSQGATA